MAPAGNPQPLYNKDEKALCFHGELLYEAKVLENKVKESADKKDGFMYRVHYKGWKTTSVLPRCLPVRGPRVCGGPLHREGPRSSLDLCSIPS